MRSFACGLLILAASVLPAAAQSSKQVPWPTLEEARTTDQCDASEWAETIAAIKGADPEQDAEKQIATGDFTLKSGTPTISFVTIEDPRLWTLGGEMWRAPAGVRCTLPVRHVKALNVEQHRPIPGTGIVIVQRITPGIASTWCGRAMLMLEEDYAARFNGRVVGHQTYPHKDVCSSAPSGGSLRTERKVSDRPTPDLTPAEIPDIATAARFGLTDRIAKFIADGADVAHRDIFGFDALKWSVMRDYRLVFDLIIAAGGTPDFCAALKEAIEHDRQGPLCRWRRGARPGSAWSFSSQR